MKKWRSFTLFSLIICLASFAILFAPNLKVSNLSADLDVELNVEHIYESDSTERNYGAIPRKKYRIDENYSELVRTISSENLPSSYNLSNEINIEVKNQEQYGLCYAFAGLSTLETTIAKNFGEYYSFSEIYVPYAETLNAGESVVSLNGGNFNNVINVANAYGLALDSEMPYPTFTYTSNIPTITNAYGTGTRYNLSPDGSSFYYQYDLSDVQISAIKNVAKTIDLTNAGFDFPSDVSDTAERRLAIKNHIYNYGAVYAEFYYNDSFLSNGIYEYTGDLGINHAVTLVGWDDSKNAYIALNSWGKNWGTNGYFYVSYNDVHIENGVSGFIPEGIDFEKEQDNGSLAGNGELYGFSNISGIRDVVGILKNTQSETVYVDKINLPLNNLDEKISVSYKVIPDLSSININSEFIEIKTNFIPSNDYIYSISSIFNEGLYCLELENAIEVSSGAGIAIKVAYEKKESPFYLYNKGTCTSNITYLYTGSKYQTYVYGSYDVIFNVQAMYSRSSAEYSIDTGTLNDSVTSNYIDYFASSGGAIYIPIGVEDEAVTYQEYDVRIQKLSRLTKETLTSGYSIKHSGVDPNFDSNSDGILDKQNIYIEFGSKPAVGSYVATITYGEKTINKYFEIVTTSQVKPLYNITYNLNGATENDNPTKFYEGWKNVILSSVASNNAEFEGWTSGGNKVTSIITTNGDVAVTASWASNSAELKVNINEIEDFTYDGTERILSCEIANTYSTDSYKEQVIEWYKDGSNDVYSTEDSLTIKNVQDGGTYKCVVTLKDSSGNTITSAESETTINIAKRPLSFYPISSYSKKYNETDPTFVYGYTGAASNETPGFNGTLSREEGDEVGEYLLNKGTLEVVDNGTFYVSNYSISFNNDSSHYLQITKATLVVKIFSSNCEGNQTKTYGDADPEVELMVVSGLKSGENAVFNGDIIRETGENVGEYVYGINNITLDLVNGSANPKNYNLSLETAKLRIEKREVILTLYVNDSVYTGPISYDGNKKTAKIELGNKVGLDQVTISIQESTSILEATNVGIYNIYVTGISNSNYKLPEQTILTWNISKAVTEVPQPTISATYGDKLFDIDLSDGFAWNTSIYDENTFVGNVGIQSFEVIYTPENTDNYEIVNTQINITVVAKELLVSPNGNVVKKLGQNDSTIEFSFVGAVFGENPTYSGSLGREEGETAGVYELNIGTLTLVDGNSFLADNYSLKFSNENNYKFYIGALSLTLSESQEKATYDGTSLTISVINSSTTYPNDYYASEVYIWNKILTGGGKEQVGRFETIEEASLSFKNVEDSATYECYYGIYTKNGILIDSTTSNTSISIGAKTLIVTTITSYTKNYGEADPTFEYNYNGQISGEIPAFSGALSRASGENVGSYAINQGTLALADSETFKASNYSILFDNINGYVLTINKATLKLQVSSSNGDGNQTKTYGDSDPMVSLKVVSGLKDGEEVRFNKTVGRTLGENVGEYEYNIDDISLISGTGYANPDNYELELEPAKLTIEQREVTLSLYVVGNTDTLYVNPITFSNIEIELVVKPGNIITGDNVQLIYTNESILKAINAGIYNIVVDSVDNSNYKLPENKAFTWEISKATPSFTIPYLTATYGDKLIDVELTTGFTWDTAYDETTYVGNVSGNPHYFNAIYTPNDAINYESVNVTLSVQVNAKKLTITPKSGQYKIYDGAGGINSVLTFDIDETDLILGETAKTSGQLTRQDLNNKNVGLYEILVGTLKLENNGAFNKSNYEIEFVSGINYEIKAKEISLKFKNYENLYFDGIEKEIEVDFENKISGDDISIVFKNEKLEENQTNAISVRDGNIYVTNKGVYDIEIDSLLGEDKGNYSYKEELNFEFEIRNATIIITPILGQEKTYGDSDTTILYNYTGAKEGQEPKFKGELSRMLGENVGSYAIMLGTLELENNGDFIASNYELVLSTTNVYYEINARTITLSANLDATAIAKNFDGKKGYSSTGNIIFGTHFIADEGCILESDKEKISISVNSAYYDSQFVSIYDGSEYVSGARYLIISGFDLKNSGESKEKNNYILDIETTSLSINGIINPATLTMFVSPVNRVYNGSNTVGVQFGTLAGIIEDYEVALEQTTGTATLSSANVGEYNYLNGDISLTNPSLIDTTGNNYQNNYRLVVSDFSVIISQKVVKAEDISWVKGTIDSFDVITANSFTYSGENQFETLHAYYIAVDGETKNWLTLSVGNGEIFKNAGQYIIEVTNLDTNYNLLSEAKSRKITILQKELTLKLDKSNYEKVYDGLNNMDITFIGLEGILNQDNVNLLSAPTKLVANSANVGVYSFESENLAFDIVLSLTGYDSNNYALKIVGIIFEIEQKIVEVDEISWSFEGNSISMANSKIELDYNGINQLTNLTAKFVANETTYNLVLEVVSGGDIVKDAGTYQVRAISQAGENVGISAENPVVITIEIAKKNLYVNLLTENKIYDGNNIVTMSSYYINGIATGDEISLNLDELVLTTENKNVGENLSIIINGKESQTAGILEAIILGNETTLDNYNLYVNAPAITILQKEVYPSWESSSLIYNGTEQVPVCLLEGVITGDDCKGIFDGYTRYVTLAPVVAHIRGLTNSNYKLSTDNTSILFTISPATIKIKTTDLSVPEGSQGDYSFEVIEGTLYEGDDLHISYGLRKIDGEDYKYKITAEGFNTNYTIQYEYGTLTEIPVNRTFVIIVFGFIVVFFVVEIIVIRVKAIKKEKSKPTLKAEGEKNGNND